MVFFVTTTPCAIQVHFVEVQPSIVLLITLSFLKFSLLNRTGRRGSDIDIINGTQDGFSCSLTQVSSLLSFEKDKTAETSTCLG